MLACTCIRSTLKAGQIKGRVLFTVNDQPREPIPGATITLLKCVDGNCQTVADAKADSRGQFSIEGVKSDEYDLLASAPNFQRVWVKLKFKAKHNTEEEIIFGLEPTLDCCAGFAQIRKLKAKRRV